MYFSPLKSGGENKSRQASIKYERTNLRKYKSTFAVTKAKSRQKSQDKSSRSSSSSSSSSSTSTSVLEVIFFKEKSFDAFRKRGQLECER